MEEVETSKGVGLAVMTAAEGASVVVQRPPLEASALLDMHGNGRLCAADPFALQQSKPIAILQTTQVDKTGSDEEKEEEALSVATTPTASIEPPKGPRESVSLPPPAAHSCYTSMGDAPGALTSAPPPPEQPQYCYMANSVAPLPQAQAPSARQLQQPASCMPYSSQIGGAPPHYPQTTVPMPMMQPTPSAAQYPYTNPTMCAPPSAFHPQPSLAPQAGPFSGLAYGSQGAATPGAAAVTSQMMSVPPYASSYSRPPYHDSTHHNGMSLAQLSAGADAAAPVKGSALSLAPSYHQNHHHLGGLSLEAAGGLSVSPPRQSAQRKTEIPAARLRKVHDFILKLGRKPTRKASDPAEKTLGIWLHRFTCNDDGVKERAKQTLAPDEFNAILRTIENAPDAKQVADRATALNNVEAIAYRTLQLQAIPLRGDPSGCGKKLHNIRQGRLAPSMREDAIAIVHRVIGPSSQHAHLVKALENVIEHSVTMHSEQLVSRGRPAPRNVPTFSAGNELGETAASPSSMQPHGDALVHAGMAEQQQQHAAAAVLQHAASVVHQQQAVQQQQQAAAAAAAAQQQQQAAAAAAAAQQQQVAAQVAAQQQAVAAAAAAQQQQAVQQQQQAATAAAAQQQAMMTIAAAQPPQVQPYHLAMGVASAQQQPQVMQQLQQLQQPPQQFYPKYQNQQPFVGAPQPMLSQPMLSQQPTTLYSNNGIGPGPSTAAMHPMQVQPSHQATYGLNHAYSAMMPQ